MRKIKDRRPFKGELYKSESLFKNSIRRRSFLNDKQKSEGFGNKKDKNNR